MRHWYFAYGSNMLTEQMIARTGHPGLADKAPRMAYLPDHRLAFNMRGEDGNLYANLVPSGPGVYGILYCCDLEVLNKLDVFESGYDRHNVLVTDAAETELTAVCYIARPENIHSAGTPTPSYLHKIITGARNHHLPDAYIQTIATAAGGVQPAE